MDEEQEKKLEYIAKEVKFISGVVAILFFMMIVMFCDDGMKYNNLKDKIDKVSCETIDKN